jgi:hypothetical protein
MISPPPFTLARIMRTHRSYFLLMLVGIAPPS